MKSEKQRLHLEKLAKMCKGKPGYWEGKKRGISPLKGKKHNHKTSNGYRWKWSEDSRKRMSKSMEGKVSPFKGKKHSKESLLKQSKAKLGKYIGENNPNWRGGISTKNHRIRTSKEHELWSRAILERDNWTCSKCKIRGKIDFNAHHLQNFNDYPELRFAIDNGITMCVKCHRKFHIKYGWKHTTKNQMIEFLENK